MSVIENSNVGIWRRYWFKPASYFDLAIIRIAAVGLWLWRINLHCGIPRLTSLSTGPDELYQPLILFNILNLPIGWGAQPDLAVLEFVFYAALMSGTLALIGMFTNASLLVFASCSVYLQAFVFSFGEIHHTDEIVMIALVALALSPSGQALSIDAWRQNRLAPNLAKKTSEFAGWPIRLLQWFFVLMYWSACVAKLRTSGADWANGFTLQYYMIQDGLRWNSELGIWFSQFHFLTYLAQHTVVLFQSTFFLAVIFPKLRWIYLPLGLFFHIAIAILMHAIFIEWIVLYAVFVPWANTVQWIKNQTNYWRRVPLGTSA